MISCLHNDMSLWLKQKPWKQPHKAIKSLLMSLLDKDLDEAFNYQNACLKTYAKFSITLQQFDVIKSLLAPELNWRHRSSVKWLFQRQIASTSLTSWFIVGPFIYFLRIRAVSKHPHLFTNFQIGSTYERLQFYSFMLFYAVFPDLLGNSCWYEIRPGCWII